MGTRRWTLSTFVGCCLWILHGLRAAAAIPVTTDGPLAVGTASPITDESERSSPLVMGTTEMTTVASNAETTESTVVETPSTPSFSPGAELDAPVTVASEYGSTAPTLMNVTKPLNASQDIESSSAAPAATTTSATISAQHPVVTPEAEPDAMGAIPNVPLGTTPLFAGVKEDILEAVTREGAEDLDPTTGSVFFLTTPPSAAASGALSRPTAGSPVGIGVTTLQSQGLSTAMGAVEEGVTLPMDSQSEASGNSLSTSTGTGGLLTTQHNGVVSEAVGITPEPAEEITPAVEESALVSVPGNMGDAVNGEFSTASSSHLPLESPTVSGTVAKQEEPSLLPGQEVLSPPASLAPAIDGDGDGQGAPGVSSEASGSVLSPTASEAPKVTDYTATSVMGSRPPSDAQSDLNLPVPATELPIGNVGVSDLAKPSLQPTPWQTHTGEQPLLPSPMGTASAPGAAYPPPGVGATTLPATDGEDAPASPDLGATQGTLVSPSPEGSQSWGTATGASQGVNGPDADFSSLSDASTPASFVPDGLTWPAGGVQGQGVEGAGDTAQAGGPEDGNSYAVTQSDTNSAFSTQQDPTNTGELPAGGTGDLVNAELSPPSDLGDGIGTVPAEGQVSMPDSIAPGSAGLEPNLSGAEGVGNLPSESVSVPEAAYPVPGAAAGPVPGAETPASPDLDATQGALVSPSPEGSQSWGTADGSSQGTGVSETNGPGTGLTSSWNGPSSGSYGPAEPPSPAFGDQLGTNLGLPAAGEQGASTAEQALGGAGSGTGLESSLSSTAGSGMAAGTDQLSGASSSSDPASPGAVVAESSVSEGDGSRPIPDAAPGPDSLSPASPDSETGPAFALVRGTESTGDVVQEGNPGSESPYMETMPSASSSQQDSANTGELPAGGTGALVDAELSPPPALADGAGAVPAEEQVSMPDSIAPGSAGLEPNLSGAEGVGNLPSESVSVPEAAYPALEAVAGPVPGAASSVLDPASPSALGEAGGAPGALQPSVGAGPWVPPAAEGAGGVEGDRVSLGQSQATAEQGSAVSGEPTGEMGAVLQPMSSSSSMEGSSSLGTTGKAANGASFPGAGGGSSGLRTGLETVGLDSEEQVSAPNIQSGAHLGLSDANLSQVNVVELPGGTSVSGRPSPGASLEEGAGAITSGALAPPALSSPQEMQPLVTAPDSSSGSNGMASSLAASLLPGHGLSSELAPRRDPSSAPSTQSGSRSLVPGAPGGLEGNAGGVQTWALEDEVASGMPAPLGETSPHAPASSNAALALPSTPQEENAAQGVSTRPGLSVPLSACESIVGSSARGRGELGDAVQGGPPLLLPAHQPESPGFPSGDAGSSVARDASAMLPGIMAGRGDMARLLPSVTGAGAGVETPAGTLLGGTPGLPRLPPAGITAGSPGSKTSEPEPAGGFSLTALKPFLDGELITSLPNRAPDTALPRGPAAAPTPLPGPAVAAVPLYGYGARENDREYVQRRVDFNSPLFKPETGFPFGKTLHDSLYFTDNGQIIFPASDNSIFTYSNPPPSGFNGHEEVPMIAVFWDNADFSRGVGTMFYQEFLTLNTAKPPFIRDVEAKIRRYLRSSYSAAWTLKITWEKAPAYAARTDTRRTITYQAILTTDGFRSYILMLYQQGGMQWDYTRLAATNVLIGYTSGDGSYHNDDLTQKPPAAKYRPDQFRGYNTDLRGLWIYKLESRVSVNYRLKCLAWTGRQQEPQVWSQGLPNCPCSLQQGQEDSRFKSSRRGWWAARISMLHSASPNQHGAGVRCLYDSQGQLIEGRQERYWRSSRQASPYRDQELKLYDWCCNQAGSAHLCAHYSEKRPKIGCDGYQSPSTAGSSEEEESDSEEQRDGDDK